MQEVFLNTVKFIRDLYGEPNEFIPLHSPVFEGNEKQYLEECIDSTFVSSVGKYVDKFEEIVAEYTESKKAVVCVNGTNALHIAMMFAGVEKNTEVITQPLTFIATANAISYCGAHPVFIDVDKDTMGLSPKALEEWLSNNVAIDGKDIPVNKLTKRKITACVPMHTFGHPCRIDQIVEICNEFNIPVVEDAAESLGSFYKSQHTGTLGKLGILSFNGNKTITTGGGGMILTQDENLGNHIKHITTQSKITHPWEYMHDEIGYNYRMPNINAALGVAQMERLNDYLINKRNTAQQYRLFFDNSEIEFKEEPGNSRSNFWLNAVILQDKLQRDEFLQFTNDHLVMTRPIWRLMNELEMFKNCQTGNLKNAQWLQDRVVNIPSSVNLKSLK